MGSVVASLYLLWGIFFSFGAWAEQFEVSPMYFPDLSKSGGTLACEDLDLPGRPTIKGAADLQKLLSEVQKQDFSKTDIQKFCVENAMAGREAECSGSQGDNYWSAQLCPSLDYRTRALQDVSSRYLGELNKPLMIVGNLHASLNLSGNRGQPDMAQGLNGTLRDLHLVANSRVHYRYRSNYKDHETCVWSHLARSHETKNQGQNFCKWIDCAS